MRSFLVLVALSTLASSASPGGTSGEAFVHDAHLTGSLSFGRSASISGDRIAVGSLAGQAGVYVRTVVSWNLEQTLAGSADERFGYDVAIDGDTLAVSAPYTSVGPNAGSVHVFVRTAGVWTLQQVLAASDGAGGDLLGLDVALDGDTLVAGAWHDDDVGPDTGSAYVFVRNGTTWTEQQKLVLPVPWNEAGFGRTVALEDDTLVVGAPQGAFNRGSAFVFARAAGNWSLVQELVAPDGNVSDDFGSSLALEGDTLIVGAPRADVPIFDGGAAYVYTRAGGTFSFQSKLVAERVGSQDTFGSVALSGSRLLLGGAGVDDLGPGSGVALVFERVGTTWFETQRIAAKLPSSPGGFGSAVALQGGTAVVGRPTDAPFSAFVFEDVPSPVATFCDAADGSLAACPCGNPGSPKSGCDISHGTGGVRLEVLSLDPASNLATFHASGFPASSLPACLVVRASSLQPATPFGDGVLCLASGAITRIGTGTPSPGRVILVHAHGAGAGTFHYQAWLRNLPASFCDPAAAFNLSSGVSITW